MKTTKILAATLVTATALSGFASASQADDGPLTADTDATVKIEAGTVTPGGGNLGIVQAPNFDFGTLTAGTLVAYAGETTTPVIVPSGAEGKDGYVAPKSDEGLVVRDYRGAVSGWNVTANISEFKTDSAASVLGSQFTLIKASSVFDAKGAAKSGIVVPENVTLSGTDAPVVSASAADAGAASLGETNIEYKGDPENKTGAKLDIPDGALAGTYKATITWTLSDTLA